MPVHGLKDRDRGADNFLVDESYLYERAPAGAAGIPSEQDREDVLRRLLERFEAGRMPADEYTRKVQAVQRAATLSDMVAAAEAPSDDMGAMRHLDAVDALLLARQAQSKAGPARRPRYVWAGMLLFFMLVLIVVGAWLVAHAKALHNSGNTGTVSPSALVVSSP